MTINDSHALHIPVLLPEVLNLLNPQLGDRYLDLTAGYGGHARAVLEKTRSVATSLLVDRDTFALDTLEDLKSAGSTLMHTDYLTAATELRDTRESFDLILMDIGVSSPQLDRSERGFSFMNDGPLDMRMDRSKGQSAADLVNTASADELASIILRFGEETRGNSRLVAQAIIDSRPLSTTSQLASVVTDALGGRKGRIHPATKTFQALRLAVNDELGQLAGVLPILPELLNPGGRLAIISFHSLEDRIVKRYFKDQAHAGYEAVLQILTPKPIAGNQYDNNPRARSAKLRAAVKI